jgi:hypothetical protein
MTLLELLARDIDIIADGLESLNQGEDFDLEMKGYIESHRVCAQHIREVLKWMGGGKKCQKEQRSTKSTMPS